MKKLLIPIVAFACISASSVTLADSLTTQQKHTLTNTLKSTITESYVLEENIEAITNALNALEKTDEFNEVSTKQALAKLLSYTIRKHDKHFGVQWTDKTLNKNKKKKKYEGWFTKLTRKNHGFNKVEILDGNVGYIDFWGFNNVSDEAKNKVASIMNFVEDTDALIIDLRKNGGGSAVMIQLISSYFFDQKVHLNSFYNRKTKQLSEFWTFDDVKGKIRPNVPIYILTSNKTFSAAEEFSYNFKHLNRATLIGENTGGGANPIFYFDLGSDFRASIPISKAVNPITKTNWESVGVTPHVKVEADDAFDVAYKIALEKNLKKGENHYLKTEIKSALKALSLKK